MSNSFLKKLKENPEYFEFWQDLRVYCENLKIPDKEEFIYCLPILYKRIKNDGAGYYIYEALSKFAEKTPNDAIDLLKRIEEQGTKETLEFSASILSGLSRSKTDYLYKEKILEFINSQDQNKIYSGVDAAYRISFPNNNIDFEFLNEVHTSLKEIISLEFEEYLGIVTRFYNKHLNNIIEAKDTVISLLKLKSVYVQSEVARSLNEEFKPSTDIDYFKECLYLLSFTEIKYKNVYGIISHRLKGLINSYPDISTHFINSWISNHNKELKGVFVLRRIFEHLYFNNPKTIGLMFLNWLNSDDYYKKKSIQFIISNVSSKVDFISLPKNELKKIPETDTLYIVFMIVGNILDYKYVSEMLYNILEVNYNNKRIRNHIASLFVKYLIINYYSVTDILKGKKKSANKIISSIIDQIIEASEDYYKQIYDLKPVNEFEPSDKRMKYFLKQQNIQLQKLMDSNERKKDSFLDMLTSINLRAGKYFFSKYRGEYTQESEMQRFRSSVEAARVHYIDEIGQEKLRLIWQNMKRDELPN